MSNSSLVLSFRCFLLCLLVGATIASHSLGREQDTEPRAIEWQDLVPPDWEPPMIAPAYDQPGQSLVDDASLVTDLNGAAIKLPGYLRPIVFSTEQETVSEFLLVPFLPQHVKQHAHLEPNQMVYVVLDEPAVITHPFNPYWITGTLKVETVTTDEGPAGYKITGAGLEDYTF